MTKKDKIKKVSILVYEKPDLTKIGNMTFMFEPYKKSILKFICRQCSSCHGCK